MADTQRQQSWQRTLCEWRASGLSGAAFCKQHALVYHQFVYWRTKLGVRVEGEQAAGSRAGFARVALGPPGAEAVDGLTVSLPNGVSITGLHAGNVDLLGAIVSQL